MNGIADTQPPSFINCPKDQQYTNLEHEGYYMWKIPLATVKDNGPDSLIEQHVTIKQPGMVLYRDNSQWCIIKCWSVPCWDVAECFARNILFGLGMTSLKQNFTLEDLNLQLLFWGKQKRFLGILSYDKIESFNVKQIAMADVSLV